MPNYGNKRYDNQFRLSDLLESVLVKSVTSLIDFQRVELLQAMEHLGSQKPSELLADMLELCPSTQYNNVFLAVLFLQRLPREICVLLTHKDHSDLRCLALTLTSWLLSAVDSSPDKLLLLQKR